MDLKELYQEIILDHGKNPRNKKKIYIPSKWKVTFKASDYINKKLNEKI